jgi:branched-chain amino acid transport system substrate-binding protein
VLIDRLTGAEPEAARSARACIGARDFQARHRDLPVRAGRRQLRRPGRNGGQFVIEQLNKGAAPAPYDKVGFGGMKIEPVVIDENGGATKQVQELRNLYERDKVDVVLGYIGSGDCLAVAPIAEELKKMLVLMDCGTPRIFEEAKYNYVFRTAAHATMDNVGLIGT